MQERRILLSPYSATMHSGNVYPLTSPSGSGKSTLLSLIARLQRPTEGTITLEGKNIFTFSLSYYMGSIVSYLPQKPLFPSFITLAEYLPLLSNKGIAPVSLEEGMERCAITQRMKERYSHELSGGEIARIALFIALMKKTPLLLVDEPGAHLEKGRRVAMIDTITYYTLQEERLTIMALHE